MPKTYLFSRIPILKHRFGVASQPKAYSNAVPGALLFRCEIPSTLRKRCVEAIQHKHRCVEGNSRLKNPATSYLTSGCDVICLLLDVYLLRLTCLNTPPHTHRHTHPHTHRHIMTYRHTNRHTHTHMQRPLQQQRYLRELRGRQGLGAEVSATGLAFCWMICIP